MKVELKELSIHDGKDVYEMILEIGLGENGFTNSFPTNSFEEFTNSLARFVEVSKGIDLLDGYVPQTIYWLYVNGKPIAYGKLRHHLNEKLQEYGGHIGYIVRPSERGKGYGKLFLAEVLKAAKNMKIDELLITCDEDNQRSRRVIEGNNGQLNEIKNGVCKYWIRNMKVWERKIIETARGEFEIFIKGEGTPICITHHYSEFNDSGDPFAEVISENNKVILVNLREAGNSAKAVEPYQLSLIEAVFDLEDIRNKLGFDCWNFAGHSTGGMIGLLYGIHFSSSLDSLILVGTAAREYASSSSECIYNEGHPKFKRMQELIERLKRPSLSHLERKELSKERTKLSLYYPEKYEQYFSGNITKKMSAKRMDFFAREVLIFGVTEQLSKIKTRTLILCGRHDVQCPVIFSIEISNLIPNSSLHIFEQSNHYPFLEEKLEYMRVITEFQK